MSLRRVLSAVLAALTGMIVGSAPARAADPTVDGEWFVAYLKLGQAHRMAEGGGVIVAIVDTGVEAAHPHLKGSVIAGADFSADPTSDGLVDTDGRGTAMAGMILGNKEPFSKTPGVAPAATVMSVRVSADSSESSAATTAKGITWAVDHGARVLVLSTTHDTDDPVLKQSVQHALSRDAVIIAGARELPPGGLDNHEVGYPAAYPGVLAVGGVGQQGAHSPFSVTSAQIALTAPCGVAFTTYTDHQIWAISGIYLAAAIVAGAAALLRSQHPELPAAEIMRRLTTTADDKGPAGRDDQFGYGIVDIVAALTVGMDPADIPTADTPPAAGSTPPFGLAVVTAVCLVVIAVVIVRRRRTTRHRQ